MLATSPFVDGRQLAPGLIAVKSLTWEGREFLDAVRGDDIWKKTKLEAEKIGGVGVAFVWEIAQSVIKHELKTPLGIDAA